MRAGALNLASPEVKIHMDSAESSDPIDVEQKEQFETNSLVEEFMLLANISVARKIQQTFPMTAVLRFVLDISLAGALAHYCATRRHMPPPRTNFEKLQDLLWKLKGVKLDVSSSGALASSLDACVVRSCTQKCTFEVLNFLHRIPMSLRSIRLSASWQQDACCLPSISVREVYLMTLLDIMA